MRTTLDIDDDVLEAAKEIGRARKQTAGQVISELARKTLSGTPQTVSFKVRNGFPYLPRTDDRVVTNDMVNRIRDEIDEEDARNAGAFGYKRSSGTE